MSTTNIVLVLTGARAGKTCTLSKYPFVNGRLTLYGDTLAMAGIIKYLGRSFKAFPEGSAELAHYQQLDGGVNGQRNLQEAPGRGDPATIQSGSQPDGQGAQAVPAADGAGAAGAATGTAGVRAEGDGQAESLKKALSMLDPHNDEHWTSDGLPRLEVVAGFYGRKVTRGDLLAFAPSFVRP